MYKLYVRPYLDYGSVVYQNQNSSLMTKLQSTQYATALLVRVSGASHESNTDKLFEERNSDGNLWPLGDDTEDFTYFIKL